MSKGGSRTSFRFSLAFEDQLCVAADAARPFRASASGANMNISFDRMPFPITREKIADTERKLGRRLPSSYVGRMLEENGGVVSTATEEWWLFPIFDNSDRTRLKRTGNDILQETDKAKSWTGFPQSALAIASNGEGDLLLFLSDKSGTFNSAVYLWDHETGHLDVVADDFVDLPKRSA